MVRALQDIGAIVDSNDLYPYRGFGPGFDFMERKPHDGYDWIITNPPFAQAEAFIRHALAWDSFGVAMLLKSQYWHAARRYALFIEHPPTAIMPLTWRPDFLFGSKGGAPTMEVAWSLWIRGYDGPTQYIPLPKPKGIPDAGRRGGPRLHYTAHLLRAKYPEDEEERRARQ
jgi:hypothetical protein